MQVKSRLIYLLFKPHPCFFVFFFFKSTVVRYCLQICYKSEINADVFVQHFHYKCNAKLTGAAAYLDLSAGTGSTEFS